MKTKLEIYNHIACALQRFIKTTAMKKIAMTLVMAMSICYVDAQIASERDKKFIAEATQISLFEIKLGELAQSNTSTPEIKTLGQHMIDDHTKAINELKALGAKKSIVIPTILTPEEYKKYDKIVKKQGKDFDKAYVNCMVKGHKKALCKFKKEAKDGDDYDVRTWASNSVPTLQQHENMSEETCSVVHKKG